MMKWGKKGSHSSPTYLINHVFPMCWLKRLKRKGGSFQPGTKHAKHEVEVNEMSRCSSMPTKWMEGRFGGTDDLYWRLSFGEDSIDDFDDAPKSRCKRPTTRSLDGNKLRFNNTILELKDVKKKQYKVRNMQEKYQHKGIIAREQRLNAQALYAWKDQEQRSSKRLVLKEKKSNLNKRYINKQEGMLRSAQKDLYETKQLKTVKIRDALQKSRVLDCRRKWNLLCPSCSASIFKENHEFDNSDEVDSDVYPEEEFISEVHKSKHKKINEIISKNRHHRPSVRLRRRVRIKQRKSNRKINSTMGRNATKTDFKTRATEFMKKEQRKKRINKDIDIGAEEKTGFDSYAVQKSSYDPQQDFRDSMLEMIIEKDIKQPKELEELLVCYLTHNSVDYHDLIIKVFRQVWFDLNQVYFAAVW